VLFSSPSVFTFSVLCSFSEGTEQNENQELEELDVALEKKTNGIEEQNDAEEGGSGDGSTEKCDHNQGKTTTDIPTTKSKSSNKRVTEKNKKELLNSVSAKKKKINGNENNIPLKRGTLPFCFYIFCTLFI
jgi:hypothetical protein